MAAAAAAAATAPPGGDLAAPAAMAPPGGDPATPAEGERECPLCLLTLPVARFPRVSTCAHRSCESCLRQYLRIEISESRVDVACPECAERLHPNDMRAALADDRLTDKYERFMLRRTLVTHPDARWCPAPDCG